MSENIEQHSTGDQSPNVVSGGGDVTITYNNHETTLGTVIPNFLSEFFSLLTGPRAFFASFRPEHAKALKQALLFLILAAIAGFLLRAPSYGSIGEYWRQALVTMVTNIPTALVLGSVAWLACRIVGGKGSLRGHVTLFCYMAGIGAVLFALAVLLAQGVIMAGLPDQFALYREYIALFFVDAEMISDPRFDALQEGYWLEASMAVLLGGSLLIAGWLVVAWRAMGDLARLKGGRFIASLMIFLLLGYAVDRVLALIHLARGVSIV